MELVFVPLPGVGGGLEPRYHGHMTGVDDRIYRNAPPAEVEALRRFRAAHPYRRADIAGVEWEHIAAGDGERVLLFLPGSLGTGESAWQSIDHFSSRFRVIAPSYAAVSTMAGLADGIAALLDRERIERAAVIGGSYGGMVAQVFVRRHPGRTESLILSHTVLPDPARGKKIAGVVRVLPFFPMPLLRALFRKRMAGLLPNLPELAMTRAYLEEAVRRLEKRKMIPGYRCVVDFDTSCRFAPDDLDGWPGRILLLMADNDPATPEPQRAAMQILYPRAEVRLFHGSGHATAILHREEYLAAMDQFLG